MSVLWSGLLSLVAVIRAKFVFIDGDDGIHRTAMESEHIGTDNAFVRSQQSVHNRTPVLLAFSLALPFEARERWRAGEDGAEPESGREVRGRPPRDGSYACSHRARVATIRRANRVHTLTVYIK